MSLLELRWRLWPVAYWMRRLLRIHSRLVLWGHRGSDYSPLPAMPIYAGPATVWVAPVGTPFPPVDAPVISSAWTRISNL